MPRQSSDVDRCPKNPQKQPQTPRRMGSSRVGELELEEESEEQKGEIVRREEEEDDAEEVGSCREGEEEVDEMGGSTRGEGEGARQDGQMVFVASRAHQEE
jgi:hypothetical protein